MRRVFLASVVLTLCGCVGDMYNVGAGSTGPLTAEPDPFALLGDDMPSGLRLDLAAARSTPSGPDFDVLMERFVRAGAPVRPDVAVDLLDRTDLAVLGIRPGPRNQADEVLILRGRYADADVERRIVAEAPVVVAMYRERRIDRTEEFTLALLDDHLLVLGDDVVVRSVIDHYLDRARPLPGSPAVAISWDYEDTQLVAVATPTPRIREILGETSPLQGIASSFDRLALRVMKTADGEMIEVRIETSSHDDALGLSALVQDEIAEVARDPYADVSGLSALLRTLRVEVEGGDVRIVGASTDAAVARFARGIIDYL